MKNRILFLWMLFYPGIWLCHGQENGQIHKMTGAQVHYGFIIPHAEEIRDISDTNPYGFEFNLLRLNTSYKSWSVFSSFWYNGLQAGWYNFQNPEVLGSAFFLTAFAEPVLVSGNRLIFSLRAGGGLSYITRIYDETENPENMFFCTHFSFPIYLAVRLRYRVSPQMNLTLSGYYNHISNGGMKQPNFGMNFPTIALGIEHLSDPFSIERKPYLIQNADDFKGWYFRSTLLGAIKVVDKTDAYPYDKTTLVSGLNFETFRRLGMHYALGFGAEYFNDRALREDILREGLDVDNKRVALTVSQDFHFGKVIFSQHFGIYVYSPYKAVDPVYQLYGMGVRLYPRIMTGVFLKAHRHMADFMGISFSYVGGKIE